MSERQRDRFWTLIEQARTPGETPPDQPRPTFLAQLLGRRASASPRGHSMSDSLKSALKALPAAEIVAFNVWLEEQLERAYRADLWDAAYLLKGGCSDDSFEYFRAWLVAQGREIFERVLADPDSLTDLPATDDPSSECEFEDLLSLAVDAYKEMGYGDLYAALPSRDQPVELVGELSDENDLEARYPRIAARWA